MENVETASLVVLVGRHHMDRSGTPFTEDMLDWKFFAELPPELHAKKRTDIIIYITALSALQLLSPFTTKVSIRVDENKKELYCSDKTWGEIYLDKEKVLTFSHDSRKQDVPFSYILDWTELSSPKKYSNEQESEKDFERIKGILVTWTVDSWLKFFKKKIKDRAISLATKAKFKGSKSEAYKALSEKILVYF